MGPWGQGLAWLFAVGHSSQSSWTGAEPDRVSGKHGRQAHLAVELGFLDHQEMSNGFQKLGLPQPVSGQVLGQEHHHVGSQFLWPGLCEEQLITLDPQARPSD